MLDADPTLLERTEQFRHYAQSSNTTSGDVRDYVASRPLWKAVEQGHVEIATLLLDRGADPNALGGYRATPLHAAAARGDMTLVQLLLDRGANPLGAQGQNATPFYAAAGAAHNDGQVIMDLLLSLGADPSLQNAEGRSPLHNSVAAFNTKPLEKLLALGVEVNRVDDMGYTALHYAALSGYLRSVVVLCGEGLNPNTKGRLEDSPVDLARQWEYSQVEQFLVSDLGCRETARLSAQMTDFSDRYEFNIAFAECLSGKASRCTNAGIKAPRIGQEPRLLVMDLYRRGCEAGSAVSCSNQAIGYRDGWLGKPDLQRARTLFTQACDEGHEKACQRLAKLQPVVD